MTDTVQTDDNHRPAGAGPVQRSVGQPDQKRAGLLAQIEACRREVAAWPAHMRVVAMLRMHPGATD